MTGFAERLAVSIAERGPVCVGIDPHAHLLEAWGLDDDAAGAERLARETIAAAAGRVAAVKPQVAFFERHGAAGYAALERVLREARDAGLLVVADAKRGDLGTTMTGYAEAWLAPGGPFEVDALTAAPFMGLGSLEPALALAAAHGKGVFVLCATSNPEAGTVQRAIDGRGASIAAAIERDVAAWNAAAGVDAVGLVVGATVVPAELGLALAHPSPILAPGFGHQGARLRDLPTILPTRAPVLANVSRSVLATRDGLVAAIDAAVEETR